MLHRGPYPAQLPWEPATPIWKHWLLLTCCRLEGEVGKCSAPFFSMLRGLQATRQVPEHMAWRRRPTDSKYLSRPSPATSGGITTLSAYRMQPRQQDSAGTNKDHVERPSGCCDGTNGAGKGRLVGPQMRRSQSSVSCFPPHPNRIDGRYGELCR